MPVCSVPVEVAGRRGGPEAAARSARYEALATVSERAGATAVVLGHTRDDQAETVLLALARGAGSRGMAGMPPVRLINGMRFLRPLLDVSRAETRAACAAMGLEPWDDPHNTDPAYARARVRSALPALVAVLGEGLVANLARTAALLAADLDFLDAATGAASEAAASGSEGLSVPVLAELPPALRRRVIHRWARARTCGAELSHRHVEALDALVTRWRGQGPVALPGGVLAGRVSGRLLPLSCESEKRPTRR
jgi:tRNA(Ile)-lysidine synthase